MSLIRVIMWRTNIHLRIWRLSRVSATLRVSETNRWQTDDRRNGDDSSRTWRSSVRLIYEGDFSSKKHLPMGWSFRHMLNRNTQSLLRIHENIIHCNSSTNRRPPISRAIVTYLQINFYFSQLMMEILAYIQKCGELIGGATSEPPPLAYISRRGDFREGRNTWDGHVGGGRSVPGNRETNKRTIYTVRHNYQTHNFKRYNFVNIRFIYMKISGIIAEGMLRLQMWK